MDPKTFKKLLQEELLAQEKRLEKRFTTKNDLKAELMGLEKRLDKKFATKDDLFSLENRMDTKFATKDDLLKMKDELISEIEKAKEDVTNDLSDVIKQVVGSIDENKAEKIDLIALTKRVARLE